MASAPRPIVYHIPVCPFSQRIEVMLHLKGKAGAVEFRRVDVTKPREEFLLKLSRGSTSLPLMDLGGGRVLKESMVILKYVEEALGGDPVCRSEPYERAVEQWMLVKEEPFTNTGYGFVLNTARDKAEGFRTALLGHYAWLDDFLTAHSPDGTFLFDRFGLAEVVYTPMLMRFWFLEYYEGFALPAEPRYDRVRRWRDACLQHPAAQQVTRDEIIKLYYDYAVGCGNGALPRGRRLSSFAFEPHWSQRPMPPADKYDRVATDEELGLTA